MGKHLRWGLFLAVVVPVLIGRAEVYGAEPDPLSNCVINLLEQELSKAQSDAPSRNSWQPNLADTQGELSFIGSVLTRHPTLVRENLQFRRSLLNTVDPVGELVRELGPNAASLEVVPGKRLSTSYLSTGEELQYDPVKIGNLKKGLTSDLEKLDLPNAGNLSEHLTALKAQAKEKGQQGDKYFKRQLKILFNLSPFLYDGQGKALFQNMPDAKAEIVRKIQEIEPAQLENFFKDQVIYHLKPIFLEKSQERGFGAIQDLFKSSFENEFLTKTLRGALEQKQSGDSSRVATQRQLSLEEIPAPVSLFRGCFGGDCSILSVPNYVLVKDTKVYWIRKGSDFSKKPDGYVFVAKAQVDGKSYPYIVTVNGATLTATDVGAVIKLVASDWNAERVVLPDLKKSPYLVNTQTIRDGMGLKSGRPVRVELPSGWNVVEKHTSQNSRQYQNYYAGEQLQEGYLAPVERSQNVVTHPEVLGYAPTQMEKISKLDRALLGAQSLMHDPNLNVTKREEILRLLSVSEAEINAAKPIIEVSQNKPLTAKQYETARDVLSFGPEDLLKLDPFSKAHSIGLLYETRRDLFDAKTWAELIANADKSLVKDFAVSGEIKSLTPTAAVVSIEGVDLTIPKAYLLDGKWEIGQRIRAFDPVRLTENEQLFSAFFEARKAILKDYNPERLLRPLPELLASPKSKVRHMAADELLLANNSREEFSKFRGLAHLTGIDVVDRYLYHVGEERLARDLLRAFSSAEIEVRQFADKVLEKVDSKRYPVKEVFSEMRRFQEDSNVSFESATRIFLESVDGSIEKKTSLVLMQVGMEGSRFEEYLRRVPETQRKRVLDEIDDRTGLAPYLKLAKEKGVLPFFLENTKLESVSVHSFSFPKEGRTFELGSPANEPGRSSNERQRTVTLKQSFGLGKTTVTQLQYALVMGENPSRFTSNGIEIVIDGKKILVDPNRPVEQVSYHNAVEFSRRMSALDPKFNWDLPTESQWEAAVRDGSQNPKDAYYFGNNPDDLWVHGHFYENSKNQTHPVAQRRADRNGVFDMAGNVWQWMKDWYTDKPIGGVDPQGPESGSDRVLRGGSWYYFAQFARSAYRFN
ncbi:MAG: formylglycine-generating enzyme family protein [Bacteriovoracia bacterium]